MKRVGRGFSLIELLIALAIVGILLALAMPSYRMWIGNSRIRSAAESIQNGLQLARGEAVRRNTRVRFQLVSALKDDCVLSTTATSWVVSFDKGDDGDVVGNCDVDPFDESVAVSTETNETLRIIQKRSAAEGTDDVLADASGNTISFNGLGRLFPISPALAAVPASIGVKPGSSMGSGDFRSLRVTVSSTGQIRMCDPNRPTGDPQKC